jgi:alpha-ribazole phosphatase
MALHLLRHTKPNISNGICYGQSDIGLAPSFEEEWTQLKGTLTFPIDQLISSPLKRCTLLAEKISAELKIPFHTDARILELNFGAWELQAWDAIPNDALQAWMDQYDVVRCPEGESYADLKQRVDDFLQSLCTNVHYLVITHAGVIKYIHDRMEHTNNFAYKIGYGELYSVVLDKSK